MKPAAKTAIKVVLGIYVVVVAVFLMTAVRRSKPKNQQELVQTLQKNLENVRAEWAEEDPQHIRSRSISEEEAETVLSNYIQERGNIISVNYTMIMQWLNFGVLLLALYGFLWDPLMDFLDERRKSVSNRLKEAEENKKESEELLEQRQEELAEIKQERADIIEQGRREAKRQQEQLREQARQEAERITSEARERMEEEVRRARAELRGEVGDLATDVAEKMLERELSDEDQDRMFEDMLDRLEEHGLDEEGQQE